MSSAIAGFMGGLYVKSGTTSSKIAEITEATLTVNQNMIEVTSKDSNGWAENIGGIKSWDVSADAYYRSDDTTGQDVLYAALTNGTASVIELWPKDTASGKGYTGSVHVESFEVGVPLDDAVSLSLSLTGTGELHTASKS